MARDAGDSKAAREHLKAALALAPDDLPTMLALAEAEDELDDVAEAERSTSR
jgi:Tfp pilus assembly protein PilF